MSQVLTIGKLAKKSDVSIDSIRFYERKGLLAEPMRTESNYRVYHQDTANRLRFIKKAQKLGFALGEIQELLNLSQDPTASKANIKQIAEEKIDDIQNKIRNLTRMLKALEQLDECCDGHGPATECPILKSLTEDDDSTSHHKITNEVSYES